MPMQRVCGVYGTPGNSDGEVERVDVILRIGDSEKREETLGGNDLGPRALERLKNKIGQGLKPPPKRKRKGEALPV